MPKSFVLFSDPVFERAGEFSFGTDAVDRKGIAALSSAEATLLRALDIVVSLIAIAALAPLLILICLLIVVRNPGPIFFIQRRIGRDGRSFRCFKFRTMVVDAEHRLAELLASDPVARAEWALDHKLRNDPRILPGGDLLRKSSLDELPQLLNVLRGDMSIVGPRPIVESEIVRYGRYFDHYCAVRPGLTGLWQISGRNDVSYRRRVACDISYARAKSLSSDLRIMLLTVPAVLMAKGSY